MKNILWISWQEHRRTRGICDALHIPLIVLTSSKRRLFRYISLSIKTVKTILQKNPAVLIVQNPSIILTLISILLRKIFKYRVVVDAHNEAIEPYIFNISLFKKLSRYLILKSDLTIVTNKFLANKISDIGGVYFVLPDKIPKIKNFENNRIHKQFTLVLISTFTKDELFYEVIKACCENPVKVELYVTGNYNQLPKSYIYSLPKNIHFTGFLPDQKYFSLLSAADAIIDLTKMRDCLVCGAYEGICFEKPLLLSDNRATRHYFKKGVMYTNGKSEDIMQKILIIKENLPLLSKEIIELKKELEKEWWEIANSFLEMIHNL